MNNLDLLADLHRDGERQGPGGDADTRLAMRLAGLDRERNLQIADIGCGTGAAALLLARELEARITAVDLVQDFLHILEDRADRAGLTGRITTLAASMAELPLAEAAFDAVWSEGAIYNIGFANGIKAWRRFLKPGGILAVSELTWLTAARPTELEQHWRREYPEVATAAEKLRLLEECGYSPVGYFALPEVSWQDNFYRPLQRRFAGFLARHADSEAARSVVAAERREIDLYERYAPFVGYGFYIARRAPDASAGRAG